MFNNLTCLLIKSVTETLKCLNFLIIFLGMIDYQYNGKDDFLLIALSGWALYLLTTATIKFINKNNKFKNVKVSISMFINLTISFFIIKDLQWTYMPYCALYFLTVILYSVMHYGYKIDNVSTFIKKYVYGMGCFLSLIYFMQGFKHFEVIKIYASLYLIMSIIYIAQVNILEEYNDSGANLINENRNIKRFNLMSVVITVSSICIFTTDLFKKIYEIGSYIIEKFIYILIKPVSIVMVWWYENVLAKRGSENLKVIKQNKITNEENEIVKNANEELQKFSNVYENETTLTIAKVIVSIVFIIIVCIIIYVIYKKIMKIQIRDIQSDGLDGEERSFVLRKDRVEKSGKGSRAENLKDLHVVRRIYIDVIKTLKSRGIEYRSSYTPNEYSLFIEKTEFKAKNIGELANIYNNLRYGNKSISKDDINKAYKIKENL